MFTKISLGRVDNGKRNKNNHVVFSFVQLATFGIMIMNLGPIDYVC